MSKINTMRSYNLEQKREVFFSKIYEKYYQKVLLFMIYKTRNTETAKDLTHDVFVNLISRSPKFFIDNVEKYLMKAAMNKYIDHSRRSKFRNHLSLDIKIEKLSNLRVTPHSKWELEMDFLHACTFLSEKKKNCLMLSLDGFSYKEIAEILGITKNSVRNSINRAKKTIRREFSKTCTS